MRELALFAGAGGGLLASRILGWHTVCAVEIEPYCRGTLLKRQHEGHIEEFPIWDDVRTFDGWPWRDRVDIVSGGFPCQDISSAGNGVGITGKRSGLIFEMLRIVAEVRPRYVFAENSPRLRTKGLGVILQQLAELGYDAQWGVLGAWHAGAPHKRDRLWIVATNTNGAKLRQQQGRGSGKDREASSLVKQYGEKGNLADTDSGRCCQSKAWEMEQPRRTETVCTGNAANTDSERRQRRPGEGEARWRQPENCGLWPSEPGVGRVAHGVANRVDRIKAVGNGQVPRVAAMAWKLLSSTQKGE